MQLGAGRFRKVLHLLHALAREQEELRRRVGRATATDVKLSPRAIPEVKPERHRDQTVEKVSTK